MDRNLIELAKRPELLVGHGILERAVSKDARPYVLLSQPEPLANVPRSIVEAATAVVMVESLDEDALAQSAAGVSGVERVVGIGGGMTMDAAKYVAWKRELALVLAPSIVSVDASVTNTVAVRRDGKVEYDGFVVARPIVADLDLIATAPARLNRAGVGDLLSIQTGRYDWALGAKAGTIEFDEEIDIAAASVLEALYGIADEVAAVSDRAIEHIIRAYVAVNALLLDAGHSGPEEGSEHYFGYATEAHTGRSYVHGELIGLGTVLMSGLQGNSQAEAAAFLDRCQVEWRPERLDLEPDTLRAILGGLPTFVHDAGLPHSIINETIFDTATIDVMLASIPAPAV